MRPFLVEGTLHYFATFDWSVSYVIITENDESKWNDITGTSYNYPAKYLKYLTPGTKAIYFKGRIKNLDFRSKRQSDHPHYFGVGLIGRSYLDETAIRRAYNCDIIQYEPFDSAARKFAFVLG